MLVELSSKTFKDNAGNIKKIFFQSGLNIILGASKSDNSIGKSTFMLAIDFAFGGNDYHSQTSVEQQLGHHSINFSFKFDNVQYYFSRSTQSHNSVSICDSNYEEQQKISTDAFCSWLKEKYDLNDNFNTFRQIVHPFFRVNGKEQSDVKKFLKTHTNEPPSQSIRHFEYNFKEYNTLRLLIDEYNRLQEKNTNLKAAKKDGLIPSKISAKKEVLEYKEKISKLQNELNSLSTATNHNFENIDAKSAKTAAEIKSKISNLRRRYGRTVADIEQLENEFLRKCAVNKEDIDCLREFFPNANIKQIKDINNFHASLIKILENDRSEELVQLKAKASSIEGELKSLYKKLDSFGFKESISQIKMEKYAEIKMEIQSLQNEIDSFQKEVNLQQDISSTKNELFEQESSFLGKIKDDLNQRIITLNGSIQNSKWDPALLQFTTQLKDYYLQTDDTGSGSAQAHIMLFDMAFAQMIKPPFLAYDTYFFHELEDERTEDFLKLFKDFPIQIFIALDGDNRYSNCGDLINNKKIIHLTKENPLYGTVWGRKNI